MGEVHFLSSYSELRMETLDARHARYFTPGASLSSMKP